MNPRSILFPVLAWAMLGCRTDPAGPAQAPKVISTSATLAAANNLAIVVRIEAVGYASAHVSFLTKDGINRSGEYGFFGDSVLEIPILGLPADEAIGLIPRLAEPSGQTTTIDSLTVRTGSIPAWIPSITTSFTSDTSPGYVALSLPGGPVIVDNQGIVVWYLHSPDLTLNSFQAHANGRYSLFGVSDSVRAFRIYDELGRRVGTLACLGYETRFHDLLITAEDTAWVICDEHRIYDLSPLGGADSVIVTGTVIQHLDPRGMPLFQWRLLDQLNPLAELSSVSPNTSRLNFSHGNAIALDTDGNPVVSLRELDQVVKVNVETGAIMWRLSGGNADLRLDNDGKGHFARQHGLRSTGTAGGFVLLDNGDTAPSRLVGIEVMEATGTARTILDYRLSPNTFTLVGGSAQFIHQTGRSLVSFGRAGEVVEVDQLGNEVWRIENLSGTYIFRAQRISGLTRDELAISSR